MGGWNAAGLAQRLSEENICKVNCLITIDPVGILLSKVGMGERAFIYYSTPKPKTNLWANIRAEADGLPFDDMIANIGGQWSNSAKYNAVANYSHGNAKKLLTKKLFNGKSASDLLINELKKVK